MNNLKYIDDFYEKLPYKPYCSDELGLTVIRPKKTAIKKSYIQINQPTQDFYLVFDIDRDFALMAWQDRNLPTPAWVSVNPLTGYAHCAYKLAGAVCTSDMARLKPLKYLAAIESAFIEKLDSDRAYARLLTKNPYHSKWKTVFFTDYAYSLDELADYVDLKGHPIRGKDASGLGRNCELFDKGRYWAYKEIREYWKPGYKKEWFQAVEDYLLSINGLFNNPLAYSEIKGIAKSIAKWTYKHFTPEAFRESQARKGRKGIGESKAKGGRASKGGGRKSKKVELLPLVLKMKEQGYTQQDIADDLSISTRTIIRWLK
jgi:hypothetical protein